MPSTKSRAASRLDGHPAVERLTQSVLGLLETRRVSADDAARVMKYAARGTFFNEKLRIVTRLQEGSISIDAALGLLEALVGNPNHMDAEHIEVVYRGRREFVAKVTTLAICLSVIASAAVMPSYLPRVSRMFSSDLRENVKAIEVVVGILSCLILFLTPPMVILWLRAMLDCILTPHHLFPGTFTVRGTYEKLIWLVSLMVTGAMGVISFVLIFQVDRVYLRFVWFTLMLAAVTMGQVSYYLVMKPVRK